MADPWLPPDLLRGFIKNGSPGDETFLELAVDGACAKVDELCGPTLLTTITDEFVPVGSRRKVMLSCRVRQLMTVVDSATGDELTGFSAWRQRLQRDDRAQIGTDLLVTFTSGADAAPTWATSAALSIAQQYLRSMRRFAQAGAQAVDAPVGFLVPKVAMDFMEDHLLIRGLAL